MNLNGPATRLRRRGALLATAAIVAIAAAACVSPATGGGGGGTTTTTTVATPVKTITNATFEWTISREADNGAFNGDINYWSAGQSDSTAGTYVATNGNATVLKKNASGNYVPIGSEAAVNWANRMNNGNGTAVTAFNNVYLGQKVRYTGGTGWVNSQTRAAEIQWTGTFSVNFYGVLVPFWFTNPKLTINTSGVGTLTATMGGYASDIATPNVRTPLPQTPNVVVATLPNVGAYNPTGFTASTGFLGATVTGVTPPQTPSGAAFWGAWPQSFVNFQVATGLGSYWYTSGSAADPKKPQEPITVAYNLAP